jgi:hypothetical protein
VAYYDFGGIQGSRVEGKVGEGVGLKMRSDCCKIRQVFYDYTGSVSGVTELKVFFDHSFEAFCK